MLALLVSLVATQPNDLYVRERLNGWQLIVERKARTDRRWERVKKELGNQLYRITRVVADAPLGSCARSPSGST